MEIPQAKPTIQEVAKHPLAYVLMVAISVVWFFVYQFSGASSLVNKNCELEKTQLRTEKKQLSIELYEERKEKNDLYNALLVRNGIIEQIKKNTDSLVREKVGNDAAEIIKK